LKTVVTGIGWVTPEGAGGGHSGGCFGFHGDRLPPIDHRRVVDNNFKHFGRLDNYTRTGLSAIAFALGDAGLDQKPLPLDLGAIFVSELGCLQTDIDYYRPLAQNTGAAPSPSLFSYTLPTSFLGEAAVYFGLRGPTFALSDCNPDAALEGIRTGLDMVQEGHCQGILAGCCEGDAPTIAFHRRPRPGAISILIENFRFRRRMGYGELKLRPTGGFDFADTTVHSLAELVRAGIKQLKAMV